VGRSDVYAHAVSVPGGVVLASGNAPDNCVLFGPDFDSLEHSCAPLLQSGGAWEIEAFDHQEWITSRYSEEGVTIHALVHCECHDPCAGNCCPGVTDPSKPCWCNDVACAVSREGGRSFSRPESPLNLVAILPFPWRPESPRGAPPAQGDFEPSSVVFHDG